MNKLKIFITLAILSLLVVGVYESFHDHNDKGVPENLVVEKPKHYSDAESKYSIKNLNELSLWRKLAFAESLTNRIAHNMTEVPSKSRLEKIID